MLRLGIVGCGRVTTMFHLKAIKEVAEVSLVAVVDRDRARMLNVRGSCGADKGYSDLSELLSDSQVDAVVINTPPGLHEEMVVQSLKAGKHVLCEKPLATSVEGATRIKEVQESTGLVVLPGHNYAFTPSLEKAQELIRDGTIGDVQNVTVAFENSLKFYGAKTDFRLKEEFGIVGDVLPHILSVTNGIAGTAEAVESAKAWRESYEVVDNINIHLRTAHGVDLECTMSWTKLIPTFKVEVTGSSGRLLTDLMKTPHEVTIESSGKTRKVGKKTGLREYARLLRLNHPSFQRQYLHFYGLVMGSEKPRMTIDDEIAVIRTIQNVVGRLSETNIS
jgi:predicted dehydrogenase